MPGLDLTRSPIRCPAEQGSVPIYRTPTIDAFFLRIRDVYGDSAQFPYHSFEGHVLTVLRRAMILADRIETCGTVVNREELSLAALGHDALFGAVPGAFGCNTSEELAARYSAQLLTEIGYPAAGIARVSSAIESTHYAVIPQSIEARILRAADLFGVGCAYSEFHSSSEALYQEHLARGGEKSFPEFIAAQLRHLGLYLSEFIDLTPLAFDSAGRSAWHVAALKNIIQLYREVFPGSVVGAELGCEADHGAEISERSCGMWISVKDSTSQKIPLGTSLPDVIRI